MTPLVSVDFKNSHAEKNENLLVLGKWNEITRHAYVLQNFCNVSL